MKKILILLSCLLSFAFAIANGVDTLPIVTRSNSSLYVKDMRYYAGYNFNLPTYFDTTQANIPTFIGNDYPGAKIYTTDSSFVWTRKVNSNGTKYWEKEGTGSGGGGSGVNIYNSDGTITGTRTVDANYNSLSFTNLLTNQFQAGTGVNYSIISMDSTFLSTNVQKGSNTSAIDLNSDSITLSQSSGKYHIRNLLNSSSQNRLIGIASSNNNIGYLNTGFGISISAGNVLLDTIQLRDTLNVTNVGSTGVGLAYATASSATNKTINVGKLVAGTNITLTKNSDSSVTIDASGGGASYTFSTGLTNTASTITNNLSTGISGDQTLIGSTSNGSGLNIKATTGTGTSGADIRALVGNNGADTALIIKNNKHVLINTAADPGAQLNVVGPVKLLFDNALHVWDVLTIDSSLQLKRIALGSNGKFLGVQGDTLAFITGGLTNSNVGSGYRLAVPNTNNIKTIAAGTGIALDSATSNTITITGTTINNNAVNRVITGSNTANTLNGNSNFTWNGVDEVKFTTSSVFYWTAIVGGNTNFIYMPNTDIQVYPNNTLTASFNGTTNKTYFQSEGSIGAKTKISGTNSLQMDNTTTVYVDTSVFARTFYLPAIATSNNHRIYIVKNQGTNILTVSDPGAATSIFTTTAVNSVTIAPGNSLTFSSDGVYWNVVGDYASSSSISSGTYTPTLTNLANVASATAYSCQYLRVGNTVTVSGRVDIDPTSTSTTTQLRISLPIASAFANANEAGGTASAPITSPVYSAGIFASSAFGEAVLQFETQTDVANNSFYFSFTYRIL